MPVPKPLNERQIDVLRWLAAGCPHRDWPDDTYKHSARALQSRGLAHVARRNGVWATEITDAGKYFVVHGGYPVDAKAKVHRPSRRRRTRPPTPAGADRQSYQEAPSRPAVPLGPEVPTGAQRLYSRLLASGGRLEIETTQKIRLVVDELRKAAYLTPGTVLKTRNRGWHHQLLYVADDPKALVAERPVPVPMRLAKAHAVARAYRDDADRHEVSSGEIARATRIVHALAEVFGAMGYRFAADGTHTPDGQFTVSYDGSRESLRISEKSGPGGAAIPHYNLRHGQRLPAWQSRRQKEFVSTGRISIVVGGQYGSGTRQSRFSDTKSRRLEDLLPAVVREIEMRFLERDQDRIEAERENEEQERRWRHVIDAAEIRAAEAFRSDELARRAREWRLWRDEAVYVDELAARLGDMPPDRRLATSEWLEWSRRRLEDTNPVATEQGMPPLPLPTREFLEPHIRGWVGNYRGFRA